MCEGNCSCSNHYTQTQPVPAGKDCGSFLKWNDTAKVWETIELAPGEIPRANEDTGCIEPFCLSTEHKVGNIGLCQAVNTTVAPGGFTPYLTTTNEVYTNESCRPVILVYTLDFSYTFLATDDALGRVYGEVSIDNGASWSLALNPGAGHFNTGGELQISGSDGVTIPILLAPGATHQWMLRIRVGNSGISDLNVQGTCAVSRYFAIGV